MPAGERVADGVKPWAVELLLPAGEWLPEGVCASPCLGCSIYRVYVVLYAAGVQEASSLF